MMTADEILEAANRAYHERRMDDWRAWHSLLCAMGLMPDGFGRLVDIAKMQEEARLRLTGRRVDPDQQDLDEYIEENSTGGDRYNPLDMGPQTSVGKRS